MFNKSGDEENNSIFRISDVANVILISSVKKEEEGLVNEIYKN